MHRVTDLEAHRIPVENEASRLPLEDGEEAGILFQVVRGSVDAGGERTVQLLGEALEVAGCPALHQRGDGPEELLVERRIFRQSSGVGLEKEAGRLGALRTWLAIGFGDESQRVPPPSFLDPVLVGTMDAGMQHGLGCPRAHVGGGHVPKVPPFRRIEAEDEPWIGAELTDSGGEGGDEIARDRLPVFGESARQNEDRVHAAHLGEERNRPGPGVRHVEEGTASGERPGKSRRHDAGMLH